MNNVLDECRINNGIWDLNACETRPESNNHERTLILLKPDSVERKIVGKIMERFENKGFNLVGMKMLLVSGDSKQAKQTKQLWSYFDLF